MNDLSKLFSGIQPKDSQEVLSRAIDHFGDDI